jgi:LEA14-like dessication related protein
MYEKILKDLLRIVEMEGIDRGSGRLARVTAIHQWMDENLVNVKATESIINSNLASEEWDTVKYHMAAKMAEELMEDAITIEMEHNKVTTQVVAFRRKK